MQATLTNGTDSLVICHGVEYAGQTGYWIGPLGERVRESEWTVRARRPVRGAYETPLGRSLRVATYPLSAYRECATQAEAEALADALADGLPADPTSLLILHDPHTLVTYTHAALQKLTVAQQGVGVRADYLFRVAAPVTTDPDPEPEP